MERFNGLGMTPGNLWRLSPARSRSISPENFTGEPRAGRHGDGGHRRRVRARPGAGLEDLAERGTSRRARRVTLADIDGPGAIQSMWFAGTVAATTPAMPSCASTGTARSSHRSSARWATSSPRAGAASPSSARCRWRSIPTAASIASGRCRSAASCRLTLENRGHRDGRLLLPDQLHADRRARRRRLLPRPVPARQPVARTRATTRMLDGVTGAGQYVGTYLAVGVTNSGWWGEGEIKFYPRRRRGVSDHLRHGHRGLFRRRLRLGRRRPVRHVHHALSGHAPGAPAGRAVPIAAALRHVPLAHRGPDPLRAGPAGDACRRWAGAAAAATCRCSATSPRWPTGTRRCQPAPFPPLPDRDYLEII